MLTTVSVTMQAWAALPGLHGARCYGLPTAAGASLQAPSYDVNHYQQV